MNTVKNAFWLFLLMISLSFSGWYFARSPKVRLIDENILAKSTDIVIHDLIVHRFNDSGHLESFLKTPLMRHTEEHNKHWFSMPYILVAQEGQPNWEISSKEATALYGGDEIHLTKNVIIHQPPYGSSQESTLSTDEMIYFPKKKYATTPLKVTLHRPGHTIQSKGMEAYLNDKRVVLLKDAKGVFEPEQG